MAHKIPNFPLHGNIWINFYSCFTMGSEEECWLWCAAKCKDGYGHLRIGGRLFTATRVMYKLHYKLDPDESYVCHTCNNPACVNPNHLYLDTHQGNIQQAANDGLLPSVKLTPAQVEEIYDLAHSGLYLQESIARAYGIRHTQVSRIKSGKRWKHLNLGN